MLLLLLFVVTKLKVSLLSLHHTLRQVLLPCQCHSPTDRGLKSIALREDLDGSESQVKLPDGVNLSLSPAAECALSCQPHPIPGGAHVFLLCN